MNWTALVVGCALLVAAPARGADPALVWRTIETPHFIIDYYVGEEHLAQRLAVVAEAAHARLSVAFDHVPRHKTEVLLTDDTDDSNGSAGVLPYALVRLYATAPDDRSELNDYDDWLAALIMHEYTHIIHTDTIHGIARVINWLLGFGERGYVYAPNQAQPRFMLEGLAVLEETEHTSGGRLRSTIYDMFLRMAALSGRLQRPDQFANYPLQWPRGASPYLYGSAFLRYIGKRFGDDTWRRVSHEYGGTWLPGGINRVLRRVTGYTFEELYPEFRGQLEEHYRAQTRQVDAADWPERARPVPLTGPREYAARPTFTPDGREVVWADSDGSSRPQLRRIIPDGDHRPGTLLLVDGAGGSVFTRDGRTLYFDATEVHRTVYFYKDLFSLDVVKGEKRQLTHGLRAAEPDLSPDGRTLAFDVNDAGSRSLELMDVTGGERRRLIGKRDDLSQVYTPAWSPDGRSIAFSWWRDGGYRDIWIVEVQTGALTRVTADRALDLDPRWSPDGKYLYFSSDRTGIYNLYAWEVATRRTFQITNGYGGAFDVAVSPDGKRAVYVGFVADGWRLEAIALDPTRWQTAPEALLDRPDAAAPRGLAGLPSRGYSPWRTLFPYTLALSSYPDAFGQVIGLALSGGDVAGYHSWSLGVGFGLARADDIQLAVSYYYARLFPGLSLSARRTLTQRGGLFVDGVNHRYIEDDYSASAGLHLPVVRRIDQSSELSFGYSFAYLRNAERDKVTLDPNLISPRLPETGRLASLALSWSWSNVRRYTFSISSEQGRALSLSIGLSLKAIGSQYEVYSASWSYQEFVPLWWRSHVLALSYSGGISGGELKRRGVYFLGGYAPQPDLLRSVVDFTRPGSASLRGYPYGGIYGDQFHVATAEYRMPIWDVEHGYSTAPLYFRRLHGAVFADCGNAMFGTFDLGQLRCGAGAELRLEILLAYYLPASLQLGYAHGFMKDGEDQLYFYLNNPF